MTTHFLYTVI